MSDDEIEKFGVLTIAVFALTYAAIFAVLIDRLCTRQKLNSTPYQFASLGIAFGGQFAALVVFFGVIPGRLARWFGIDEQSADVVQLLVALFTGLAGSVLVYLRLRSKIAANDDYDDLRQVEPAVGTHHRS